MACLESLNLDLLSWPGRFFCWSGSGEWSRAGMVQRGSASLQIPQRGDSEDRTLRFVLGEDCGPDDRSGWIDAYILYARVPQDATVS